MDRHPAPRPDLGDLTPYRSSPLDGARVVLHANENPYPPPETVMAEILERTASLELNRYPVAEAETLRRTLAGYAGVDADWVHVGDGSNEVLLQACLAFGGPGRTALVFEPTYRMQHRQARIAGTAVAELPRRGDFTVDVDAAERALAEIAPSLVFICTPNNPTGTLTPPEDLLRLAAAAPGLLVVDEAYFEFSGQTFLGHLADHPNVLVVRTLSKAFRLASVRLGYGIAHPDVLTELARVRMPYGQSAFTLLAAEVVVRRSAEVLDRVPELCAERDRLAGALSGLGAEVFASAANFVLFRPPDAQAVLDVLGEAGIVVRDFRSLPGTEGCLRVTAGRPDENDAFLRAASAALDPQYHRGP